MSTLGIDATALPAQPVGAGRYILELIRALAALDLPDELIVFAYPHGRELLALPSNSRVRWVMAGPRTPAGRMVWEQLSLPGLARQVGLDLLHSPHYTRPLRLSCASVVTFHDMTFFLCPELHTRLRRWFFPAMMRRSARLADGLIAVSESTRQDMLRILKVAPEKITAIPHGLRPEYRPLLLEGEAAEIRQAVRKKYDLPQQFILSVGTIEPRKNLPALLRAFARLRADGRVGDGISLVLVGRLGWMVEEVFRLVGELQLQEYVHFTGYLPEGDLPVVYNLARLFVYPSSYEGFGLPPLEALACGVPVITTRAPAMQEIVGEAGVLTPPGDEVALAEAMRSVLADPGLQQELRRKGLARAAQFTWERCATETYRVYRQVLKRRAERDEG